MHVFTCACIHVRSIHVSICNSRDFESYIDSDSCRARGGRFIDEMQAEHDLLTATAAEGGSQAGMYVCVCVLCGWVSCVCVCVNGRVGSLHLRRTADVRALCGRAER